MQVFIGTDHHHRLAAQVLAHSLRSRSSVPIAITLLEQHQLERAGLYWRPRDPLQSTDFSFSRFLVPALLGFRGWGLYLDGDMLCLDDPANLWTLRDDQYAVQCVQHPVHAWGDAKMDGRVQTSYSRKNWSSLMLLNCSRCTALTPEYINTASGLDLHRFHWLSGDHEIGAIQGGWNHLVEALVDKGVLVRLSGHALPKGNQFHVTWASDRPLTRPATQVRDWLLAQRSPAASRLMAVRSSDGGQS